MAAGFLGERSAQLQLGVRAGQQAAEGIELRLQVTKAAEDIKDALAFGGILRGRGDGRRCVGLQNRAPSSPEAGEMLNSAFCGAKEDAVRAWSSLKGCGFSRTAPRDENCGFSR